MFFLTNENLICQLNTKIIVSNFSNGKKINMSELIFYLSTNNNFIYFKTVQDLFNEQVLRFDISKPDIPIIDESFYPDLERAAHNFCVFKDKNGFDKAIGGINTWYDNDKNQKYSDGQAYRFRKRNA